MRMMQESFREALGRSYVSYIDPPSEYVSAIPSTMNIVDNVAYKSGILKLRISIRLIPATIKQTISVSMSANPMLIPCQTKKEMIRVLLNVTADPTDKSKPSTLSVKVTPIATMVTIAIPLIIDNKFWDDKKFGAMNENIINNTIDTISSPNCLNFMLYPQLPVLIIVLL